MAGQGQPSANIAYDPLPLTTEDVPSNALYNAPPSPDPRLSSFHTPDMHAGPLPEETSAIPVGAAQPRFMGSTLYDNGSFTRDSIATHSVGRQSEYGSVYALNDSRGAPYRDDPSGDGYRDSVPMSPVGHSRALNEKNAMYAAPRQKSRKSLLIVAAIIGLILIAAAVIVPVYFTVIKPKNTSADGSASSDSDKDHSTSGAKPTATKTPQNAVTGTDGSEITMEDGTKFTYTNKFGGYWYYDPNDPYSGSGKAQSWTPAINETFNYGIDKIRGVNLGGWLNPEPFIAPALYQKYLTNPTRAVDEWTLCQNMASDTAGGGLTQMEDHYRTFITEKDFADVAAAGLNWVRIPIGYWAVEKRANEPYLEGVSWTYFLKAIKWARKYGIRINLDLHAVPGSQNGWNHSGRLGTIGFLNGPMGYANAQRTLNIIRILAEFISQPQYKDVVAMFGILNEPQGTPMGQSTLAAFYLEAYNIVRRAGGGNGADKGVWISMHDGFFPRSSWYDMFPNADRVSLDSHPYMAFGGQSDAPMSTYANTPCTSWASSANETMTRFGLFNAGEFSNAVTDCGLYLNEVGEGTRYEGTYSKASATRVGSCTPWTDWQNYDATMKADIKQFALASMDALQNYFFWTWKIGNSSETGKVETPAWSYQLGLQEGWMPEDPREADGTCGNTSPWTPPLQSWMTGGAGAGDIPSSVSAALEWPPAQISNGGAVAALPTYTPTGTVITLKPATVTAASGEHVTHTADPGSGWNNADDNTGLYVEVAGCSYLDPWVDPGTAAPPACGGGGVPVVADGTTGTGTTEAISRRRALRPIPAPLITPPPA